MLRQIAIVCLVLLAFVAVGCGKSTSTANPTTTPATEQPKAKSADALYNQIKTGMTYEQVSKIIGDRKPVTTSESTVDTPAGQATAHVIAWQVGNSLITVIFENNKVTSKDITKIGF